MDLQFEVCSSYRVDPIQIAVSVKWPISFISEKPYLCIKSLRFIVCTSRLWKLGLIRVIALLWSAEAMQSGHGKLFIGGISWDTDEERLKEYFSSYGEVVEAIIMKDRTTGRARGFGFVVFADPAVAERVINDKHNIDGRLVKLLNLTMQSHSHILFTTLHLFQLLLVGQNGSFNYGNYKSSIVIIA